VRDLVVQSYKKTTLKKITSLEAKKTNILESEEIEDDSEEITDQDDYTEEKPSKDSNESMNESEEEESESKSPDNQFYQIKISDYIIITSTIVGIILYNTIPIINKFILLNWKYIISAFDISVIFFFIATLPFFSYYIILVFRIIHKFWVSYSFLELRIKLSICRVQIAYLGFIIMSIALIFSFHILSWPTLLIGIIILIILDYFFGKRMIEDISQAQIYFEKLRNAGKKEKNYVHPLLLILVPIVPLFLVMYYLGDPIIKITFDSFWEARISSDLGFTTIFIITMLISVCWSIVSFLIMLILGFYEKHRVDIIRYGKFLVFLGILYVVTKLIIFNFTANLQEPYITLTSLAATGGAGLVMRFAKKRIIDSGSV
jgi:hypothetical protein